MCATTVDTSGSGLSRRGQSDHDERVAGNRSDSTKTSASSSGDSMQRVLHATADIPFTPHSLSTFDMPDPDSGWASELEVEEFLVICLSRPRKLFGAVSEVCRSILNEPIDVNRVVDLAVGHAVFPLVHRNLKSIGDSPQATEILDWLNPMAMASHRNGLLLTHTLFEYQDLLAAEGIEAAVHKGVVVATRDYGDLGDRVFGDIDIFVRKDHVHKTAAIFEGIGFSAIDPVPGVVEDHWTSYRPWQSPHGNAVGFTKRIGESDQVDVDLQWGLAPRYFTLDLDPAPLWERTVSLPILTGAVRTFSLEDTYFMLCLHGAKHSWTELRQVVDIAAFLSANPTLDWGEVMAIAEKARCRRIVLLASILGARLHGAPIPDHVRAATNVPEVRDLFDRVIEWRFAERRSRVGRLMQSLSFHLRARDNRRECVGTVVHDLQVAVKKV